MFGCFQTPVQYNKVTMVYIFEMFSQVKDSLLAR